MDIIIDGNGKKTCIMQFHWISGINSVIGVKIISVSLRFGALRSKQLMVQCKELQQDHLQEDCLLQR